MLGLGKNGTVGVFARASPARSRDVYQRYATGLYRQAFLTLGDPALAGHVTREVIVDECALPPVAEQGEDDTRYRLAESVFRRCQQLAADCVDPGRLLSETERGALGLVLIGGLGGAVVEDGSQVGGPAAPPAAERGHQCRGSRIG